MSLFFSETVFLLATNLFQKCISILVFLILADPHGSMSRVLAEMVSTLFVLFSFNFCIFTSFFAFIYFLWCNDIQHHNYR